MGTLFACILNSSGGAQSVVGGPSLPPITAQGALEGGRKRRQAVLRFSTVTAETVQRLRILGARV